MHRLARAGGENHVNTIVRFRDNYAIGIKAKGFGVVFLSELSFLPDQNIFMSAALLLG